MYKNLNSIDICVLTQNIAQDGPMGPLTEPESGTFNAEISPWSGCTSGEKGEYYLYPLNFQMYLEFRRSFCTESRLETDIHGYFQHIPVEKNNKGKKEIALVLGHTMLPFYNMSNTNSAVSEDYKYDLSCIINAIIPAIHNHVGVEVKALFYSLPTTQTKGMGSAWATGSINGNVTKYQWVPNSTGLLWRLYNFTIVAFPPASNVTITSLDWETVRQRAYDNYYAIRSFDRPENTEKDAYKHHPKSATQLQVPMFITDQINRDVFDQNQGGAPDDASGLKCLKEGPLGPACAPIGGHSLWSSTNTQLNPANKASNAPVAKDIAVMVSGTSTAIMHNMAPGANAAASGVSTLLSITRAIQPYLANFQLNNESNLAHIYVFFFTGEDYNRLGSELFLKDLRGFNCTLPLKTSFTPKSGLLNACSQPNRPFMNFTALQFGQFAHFIHIDQVGKSSQLYAHLPLVPQNQYSTHQQFINNQFESHNIKVSSVTGVVPGPLLSFYEYFKTLNIPWENAPSFTTISGYDTLFDVNYQSSEDTPDKLSPENIINAAQVIADVLFMLVQNSDSQFPHYVTSTVDLDSIDNLVFKVNQSETRALWNCMSSNWNCSAFTKYLPLSYKHKNEMPKVNFYPSVYRPYSDGSFISQVIYNILLESFTASDTIVDLSEDISNVLNLNTLLGAAKCNSTNTSNLCPNYEICRGGYCKPRTTFYHPAYSPALIENGNSDADSSWMIDTNYTQMYPNNKAIWVESTWSSNVGARLSYQAHSNHSLIISILILVITTALILGFRAFSKSQHWI